MANILNVQTVGGVWIVNTDTNPTLTGGVDAPIGSWCLPEDASGFFYKFGASNTDWEQGASVDIITQTITNGVTDKAPSEDAVFDALAPLLVSSKIFMYRNFK